MKTSLNPELFKTNQKYSHCGPACLMYCLQVYGITVTQRQLRKAAGLGLIHVYLNGVEPKSLDRAAKAFGFNATEQVWTLRRPFERSVRARAKKGLPSIILVSNFSHWVAVVGYLKGKFVVRDPLCRTKRVFYYQTHIHGAFNKDRDSREYCALFVDKETE